MTNPKYVFIRNVCFTFGVLVALLCVFPPPELFDLSNYPRTSSKKTDPVSHVSAPNVEVSAVLETLKPTDDDGESKFAKIEMELDSGHVFQFTVDLADPQLSTMATNFCEANAVEIGIDIENVMSGCVEPVQSYLMEKVISAQSQLEVASVPNIISVDLDIQGRNIHFEVDASDSGSVNEQATVFCTQYGVEFGVTEETLAVCITNIQQALERPIAAHLSKASVSDSAWQDGGEATSAEITPSVQEGKSDKKEEEILAATTAEVNSKFKSQVFVTSFPLGSQNFEYRYVMDVAASSNAKTFCELFWGNLENAFTEAGMTGIDEKTCALIVEEVTLPQVQQFAETLEA